MYLEGQNRGEVDRIQRRSLALRGFGAGLPCHTTSCHPSHSTHTPDVGPLAAADGDQAAVAAEQRARCLICLQGCVCVGGGGEGGEGSRGLCTLTLTPTHLNPEPGRLLR